MNHPRTESPAWLRLVEARPGVWLDLAALSVLTVAATVVSLLAGGGPWAGVAAVMLVFFVPGYVVVAALYPAGSDAPADDRSLDGVARVALSFGLSVLIAPVLGLLWLTLLGGTTLALLGLLLVVVVLGAPVAVWRRVSVTPGRRFRMPVPGMATIRAGLVDPPLADAALNLLVAAALVSAALAGGLAFFAPVEGTGYTTFGVLTEDASGDLQAADLPTQLASGESATVTLRVDNAEHERVEYTVVAELQRVRAVDGEPTIVQRIPLDQFRESVEPGSAWTREHVVQPERLGEDLRVAYYLYRGDPPDTPTTATAYRHTYFWVDVTRSDQGGTGAP
jgi:uncharacterized membrane protein